MKIFAVVPVFNHADSAGQVARVLRGQGLQVVLVDDGCDGPSARKLDDLLRFEPELILARHEVNRGKGAAVMTGFEVALRQGATHVLQVDADGQHDLAAVPGFVAAAEADPDAVICGYPEYDASVPKIRLLTRYLTHVWVWINTLSKRIVDSMCGFRLYPLAAVMPLRTTLRGATHMDFDTEILVQLDWAGVRIVNLPVKVRYPTGGKSNFRLLRDNWRITLMHTRMFFGMLRRLPRLIARHFPKKAEQ